MTTYKLRILPLFLLVIGLTTLTSGCKKKDMSLKLNEPRNIRGVVSYKRSFPDLNDAHLEVAKKIGIHPLADREALSRTACQCTARYNRFQLSRFIGSQRFKPQPGNHHFRIAYRKRCETPPPSQRKCFRQLGTLLWSHL